MAYTYKGVGRKIAERKRKAAKRKIVSNFDQRAEARYQALLEKLGFKSPSSSGLGRQRKRD